MRPIYLDYNATTPIDPDVLRMMLPYLREEFGNPSSAHSLGPRARDAVEAARADVAALIGATADEIIFTSGGTEASNLPIRRAAKINAGHRTIVTSTVEHPATEACCGMLEREKYEKYKVRRVSPKPDGRVEPRTMAAAIYRTTALVTVVHAQNEIGTLQPITEIAAAARAYGALVHADAAQSIGRVPVYVNRLGVDLLSIAGHKRYAPKGIGVLYVRRGIDLLPLIVGAGQEWGRRPGTENVAFIVAIGAACRIAADKLDQEGYRLAALRDDLFAQLKRQIPDLVLVGHRDERLPNTLNVVFPAVSGGRLLEACPRVLASTGSACHANSEQPSAILTALGISRHAALGAVRLSLGRTTSADDIEATASSLAAAWRLVSEAPTIDVLWDQSPPRTPIGSGPPARPKAAL